MLTQQETAQYEELLSLVDKLPFKKLERLRRAARVQIKERYRKDHKRRLRGNIDPSFTQEEHERLMQFLVNPKARLANQLMYYLGLRVGETVRIKLDHIDFLNRTLVVHTEKAGTIDMLPLHDCIWTALRDWVNDRHAAILRSGGFILYSDNPVQKRPCISQDWLRNDFRRAREESGLGQVYAFSREKTGRKPRRLFTRTTHSNRHAFGTRLWRLTGDQKIVQHALRHQDSKSTDVYIHVPQQDVHDAINAAFRRPIKQSEVLRES